MDQTVVLPQLRSGLRFSPVIEGDNSFYIVEDLARNKFFKIGREEYLLINQLDQSKSLEDFFARIESDRELHFDREQASIIINWLASQQLLQQDESSLTASLKMEERRKKIIRLSRLNLIAIKVPLFNPDPLLNRIFPKLKWLTGKSFGVIWLIVFLYALQILSINWDHVTVSSSSFFSPANLVWVWLIWFGLKIFHETFHALTCYRYGGRVYETGILFILFIPLTYVNATSSWSFSSKWQRIHVAIAGMFVEIFIACLAIIFWAQQPQSVVGTIALNTAIVAGISSLIFNANPLMRFDGYYILSDMTGLPNLYSHGLQFIKNFTAKWFLGIPPRPIPHKGLKLSFIKMYGVCAFLWRILILFSLGFLASKMAGGLGILITCGALFVWLGFPFAALCNNWKVYQGHNPNLRSYFLKHLALSVVLLFFILYFVGINENISIPGVVEYEHQFIVKSQSPGFIERILVENGAMVHVGDPLVILKNNELFYEHDRIKLQINQLKIKSRLAHSNKKLAEYQIIQGQIQILEERSENLKIDINTLHINAPGDGVVLIENLHSLQDTFIPEGQEILWIISPENKRIRCAADQNDINLVHGYLGKNVSIEMSARGTGHMTGKIERIEPTASKILFNPALAAVYGGPLDVRQHVLDTSSQTMEQRSSFELFSPRFTVDVSLPPSTGVQLKEGQLATIKMKGEKNKLALLLFKTFKDWLLTKNTEIN